MDISELQTALKSAADALLRQFDRSNGFSTLGDSALAEASLVVQIAAAFSQRNAAVWAESPFLPPDCDETNHLDLLIDLSAAQCTNPELLLVEAKASAPGGRSAMIRQILKDIERLRRWPKLDILSRPTFFFWSDISSVRGIIAVVFTETVKRREDGTFGLRQGSLANWWEDSTGHLQAAEGLHEALRDALAPAVWRRVVGGKAKDGGTQTFVAYAVFEYDTPESSDSMKTAEHEAAHALVALSEGLRIEQLTLSETGEHKGSLVVDWRAARGTMPDLDLLVVAAAIAYAGAVVDFRYRAPKDNFQDVMNRLPTDTERLQEVREAAVDWGLAKDHRDASDIVVAGYELAHRAVAEHWRSIQDLAEMLRDNEVMDGDTLANWFDAVSTLDNASLQDE